MKRNSSENSIESYELNSNSSFQRKKNRGIIRDLNAIDLSEFSKANLPESLESAFSIAIFELGLKYSSPKVLTKYYLYPYSYFILILIMDL